ncbi:pirin family protein [Streptomyces boncukensis]|uniref:Pirin family protein n=1 Tax=Streptomyces boncukensis TaxID=2711219 RepID=A0A6G4X4H4_9ACTN|nr:pirin family protein [Streptomyces boncukensis]NGO71571.1 pirin family protein [Streptomyces boncukensis]
MDTDPGSPVTLRHVQRAEPRQVAGPDAQVDNKALVIAPGDFRRTDPFLLMAEDWFSSTGFDWHPHRGIETVTVVLGGVLEHGDSLGNAGTLGAGGAQWMTAGRGVIHRELAYRDEYAHTLQLWLNLPSGQKLAQTRYQDLQQGDYGVYTEPGVRVEVVSGSTGGARGPAANLWPVTGLFVTLDPDTTYSQLLASHDRAFAYIVSGTATVAGRQLWEGETAWSDPVVDPGSEDDSVSELVFTTPPGNERTTLMLFSGRPIREPVAAGGPFVMNNESELRQAYVDFEEGRFGPVPRLARVRNR